MVVDVNGFIKIVDDVDGLIADVDARVMLMVEEVDGVVVDLDASVVIVVCVVVDNISDEARAYVV